MSITRPRGWKTKVDSAARTVSVSTPALSSLTFANFGKARSLAAQAASYQEIPFQLGESVEIIQWDATGVVMVWHHA